MQIELYAPGGITGGGCFDKNEGDCRRPVAERPAVIAVSYSCCHLTGKVVNTPKKVTQISAAPAVTFLRASATFSCSS